MRRSSVLWLPNLVSTSRFALALGFVASNTVPVQLTLIGVASVTDLLDGWLARRTQAVTRFGALLDPLADRFFVLAVVISFVLGGQLTTVQAGMILFRDAMSIIGFFVARNVTWLRTIPFSARMAGKLVTAAQLATFLLVLVKPTLVPAMVLLVAVLGIVATADYTLMLWRRRAVTRSH